MILRAYYLAACLVDAVTVAGVRALAAVARVRQGGRR